MNAQTKEKCKILRYEETSSPMFSLMLNDIFPKICNHSIFYAQLMKKFQSTF